MKKIIKLYSFLFVISALTSCDDNQMMILNNKIDSLQTANALLQKELATAKKDLEGYKYSPAKLLANINLSYQKKNYGNIKNDLTLLQKYHPESSEYSKANNIYKQALNEQEIARKKAEEKKAQEEAARRAKMKPIERIMEKFGCDQIMAERIHEGRVAKGMTKEMARAAWGRPNDINRTVGSWGVHEQWCYDGHNYLYFEDGILTSWQN